MDTQFSVNEKNLAHLQPAGLWQEFARISNIPRASRKEAAIIAYIEQKARDHKLAYQKDAIGNLLVHLPATPGLEALPGIILQGHVDMVCEKNQDTQHDFDRDPLRLRIIDQWLLASDTTLGADNGVAIAMMLHYMNGGESHRKLDLLFTIDEETGLTGALNLGPEMLQYRSLINLDGEEEGIFYIGCAGGKETVGELDLEHRPFPQANTMVRLAVKGLDGGHSGADIDKQPANAIRLLARILWKECPANNLSLISINGGDKHNAICREAFAMAAIPTDAFDKLQANIRQWQALFRLELGQAEPSLQITIEKTEAQSSPQVLTADCQQKLLRILVGLPHGVLGMSRSMPGLVATSTNLASVRQEQGKAIFVTSQRSDRMSLLEEAAQIVRAVFESNGARCNFLREYPAWPPQPDSPLLSSLVKAYGEYNQGKEPLVTAIHAGLECGVIGDRQAGMDMISFGPDIRGAHTPGEKLHIESTIRTWNFLHYYLSREA